MSYLDQITVGSTTYDLYDAAIPSWARASNAPVESVNNQTGVVTLTAADVSALPASTAIPSVASDIGAIAAPTSATTDAVLAYNGTAWVAGKRMVILSYGSSTWNDFINAYNNNAVVYCRASSNSNPATGNQGRMAFMAFVNYSGSTVTSVEFQYYRSVSTHSASQQGDQVFIYKLESTNGGKWTVTTREASSKIVAGTGLSSNYNNGVLTLSNSQTGLPAISSADNGKILQVVDGTWAVDKHLVILSYGSSTWDDFITAYNNNAIIYCRASSNSNPESGTQGRMAAMVDVDSVTSPTTVSFQYYSVLTSDSTQPNDQVFTYKLNRSGTWSFNVNNISVLAITNAEIDEIVG